MRFGVDIPIPEFDNINDTLPALYDDVKSFGILLDDILNDTNTSIASNMTLEMSFVPK